MSRLPFRIFFFFIIFSTHFFCYSQNSSDFLSINYSTISKSEFKDEGGEAQLSHFDLNCITPTIKLGAKTKINNILYYRFSQYDYSSFSTEVVQFPNDFHEIKYTILARHSFSSNWEMILLPKLAIRSDFEENVSRKDLFPAVSTIFMKTSKKDNNMKWGFGLNYNNDLGKNSVIPIIAFNYTSEKMRFNAFFPNNANLIFTSAKKLEYGFAFTTDATLIHVNTLDSIEYIRTLNVHVNPTFSYNLASNFWLNLKAGMVLRRKYDLYNADFETPSDDFENKLKSSPFVQLGFSFRTKQ
jgi:Domain of unknown function (DUF6268)